MRLRMFAACAALVLSATMGTAIAADLKTPATPSPYLLGRRGIETPEADALAGISFRPFVPTRHAVLIALIAPFHGDDELANRGIGYEYSERSRLFVLSQWPANGRNVRAFPTSKFHDPQCADVHTFPGSAARRGIVWMTPRGIVLSLQADGEGDPLTLQAEWRRLVRRGACR